MNIKQTLIQARKLIEKEENWCKKHFFKDAKGKVIHDPKSKKIYSRCAAGAINTVLQKYTLDDRIDKAILVTSFLKPFVDVFERDLEDPGSISLFNDHPDTTHKDIINVFDKAIEAA